MNLSAPYRSLSAFLDQRMSIAPLVSFRIGFGLLMLFSTVRYMLLGWVDAQLIDPALHFSYFGFDWVKPLPGDWMYAIFALMVLASMGILVGFFYRISTIIFFICFTYVELIDITYYLNHYYFVSLVSFLLILVPADGDLSIDCLRNPHRRRHQVARWCILIFQLQIAIVYVYAGLAKINYDWLINALPLAIWLPAKTSIPIIGPLFKYEITAYVFSWAGMLFDTLIIAGLVWKKTRWLAYVAVVIFHTLTGLLFQIGVFPLVMIFTVTIFFSPTFHAAIQDRLKGWLKMDFLASSSDIASATSRWKLTLLILFFSFQILFPWRYLLYGGNVFWTEEGYRFSWRVMLMEKAGSATFFVKDGAEGKEGSVINRLFLNDHQEKQMAMQPDLIIQFAHFLEDHFKEQGMKDPHVRAEVMVTLNARPAQLLIDPTADLTTLEDQWTRKDWIFEPNLQQ